VKRRRRLASLVVGAVSLSAVEVDAQEAPIPPAGQAQGQRSQGQQGQTQQGQTQQRQAPQGQESKGGADSEQPSVGGYSWTDKPRKRSARRRAPRRIDTNKPVATYPGFHMMPNGQSVVWLRISKKVDVQVRHAAGRVVFVLPDVQVGVQNNTNPLVTTHFPTAVSKAQLVRTKDGAQLVVELRQTVKLTHRVTDGDSGTMLLEVTVPRRR
jgi:hypothetical protein